ncbi:hypothetical protein FB451DRAFT_1230088 [Mycena latifolia]|nr:hypothetical protein FB451DRAFT_1230088 [Mycena latifolia]
MLQVRLNRWLDPKNSGKAERLLQLMFEVLFGTAHGTEDIAKARFTAHYDEVRRLVPKDRLLEFEVKNGWAPLSKFLGKDMAMMLFPRANDTEQFKKRVATTRRAVLWERVTKFGGPLLVVAAAAMLVYARNMACELVV